MPKEGLRLLRLPEQTLRLVIGIMMGHAQLNVQRSKFKVTVASDMLENALFGLVNATS